MIQVIRRIPPIKDLPGMSFSNGQIYTCSFSSTGENEIIDVNFRRFGGTISTMGNNLTNDEYWEIVEKTSKYIHIHYCCRYHEPNTNRFQVHLTKVHDAVTGKLITSHVPIVDKSLLTPNHWVGLEHTKTVFDDSNTLLEETYLDALSLLKQHYHVVQRINIHQPVCCNLLTVSCKNAEENTITNPKFLRPLIEEIYLSLLGRQFGKEIDSSILLQDTSASTLFTCSDFEKHLDVRSTIEDDLDTPEILTKLDQADELITDRSQSQIVIPYSENKHSLLTNDLVVHFLNCSYTDLNVCIEHDASTSKLYITTGMYSNRYAESCGSDLSNKDKMSTDDKGWFDQLTLLVAKFVNEHYPEQLVGIDRIELLYVSCTIVITVFMETGYTGKRYVSIIPILELLPSIPIFDSDSDEIESASNIPSL